jgi:hypothetical protein
LTVSSGTNDGRQLKLYGTSQNALIKFDNATTSQEYSAGLNGSVFTIYDDTNSAYRFTLDSSGNVGIGTSSPSTKFEVSGGNAYFYNTASLGGIRIGYNSSNYWDIQRENVSSGRLLFSYGASEKLAFFPSGNVGIGITSLGSAAGPRLAVDNTNNVSGDSGIFSYLGSNCSNTSSAAFSALISGVGNKFYVYGNGDVVNTNNSYGAISDIKFKENIVDATPKLKDVLRLKVRNFNLKTEPNSKQIGFIAQEFEEVFPAMINVSPDTDVNGETLETTHKSIKLSVLVPILVKAIQEQQVLIEQLQAEVALLKGE